MNACRDESRLFQQAKRVGLGNAAIWLAFALSAFGQVSPEEHAKHHPDEAKSGAPPSGGMMGAGSGMMGMSKQAPLELFPSLLQSLPRTPEQRANLERLIHERGQEELLRFSTALDEFSRANDQGDYAAMQEAVGGMRSAVATLESCQDAQQALADETSARQTALRWFKKDMGMLPEEPEPAHGIWGTSWFHFFVMVILIGFAGVMIWMYFHKMRRATLLLQSLTGGASPAAANAVLANAARPVTAKAAPPAAEASPTGNGTAPSVPTTLAPKKWSGKLRIGHIFQETHNVKTFRLIDPLGGELPFTFLPGQYMTVTVLPEGKPVRRSYTIASSPSEHAHINLTIKREDEGVESRYLHDRVQVGDLLDFAGPSGSFVFTGRECRCLVFIAAGVGITPLMSVTRYLTDRSWPGEIFLLYSCHSPKEFIFKEELEFLQRRHSNLHVVATVTTAEGTDWKGPTGRITKELISKSVPDITSRRVHICGPKEMMEATEKFLAELGVPKEQVKTEAFGPAAGKPEPEAKPTEGAPAAPKALAGAVAATVTFNRSAKTAPLPAEKSVLEASEDIGVNIPFECRVGTCGVCKTKLLSGQVTMAVEEALTPEDKAAGIILACQAKSTAPISVEA